MTIIIVYLNYVFYLQVQFASNLWVLKDLSSVCKSCITNYIYQVLYYSVDFNAPYNPGKQRDQCFDAGPRLLVSYWLWYQEIWGHPLSLCWDPAHVVALCISRVAKCLQVCRTLMQVFICCVTLLPMIFGIASITPGQPYDCPQWQWGKIEEYGWINHVHPQEVMI